MAGCDAVRKEIIYHSRLFPGSRNLSHQRWLIHGRKRLFQLFSQTMNEDEFGLFYQCLPNKTDQLKSEKCYGGKLSKIRITGLAAANTMVDKLPMFVIGKAKNPRCFKNVRFLPCRYRNQRRSWMDGKLFEEWPRELDRKFAFEGRNLAFVIDNCPARPHIDNLKAIKLYFLPPNTTSKTQPMDQGVIRSLKAKYPKNVVREIIQSLEKKKTLSKISLLQGMQILVSAWDALSTQTFVNCFRKSGISTESQKTAIAEDDDPFRELQDEIDDLRSVQPDLIEKDFDATTFADVDAEVIAVQTALSDAKIVAELLETEGINDDDDCYSGEVADDPVKWPSKNELLQVIEILQRFSLFLDKGNTIQSYAGRIESQVDQHSAEKKNKKKKKKQASVRDFLNKK